jgi:hypothetical protein
LKLEDCLGEPIRKDYAERNTRRGNENSNTEVQTTVEYWFYEVDGSTWRITLEGGIVKGMQNLGKE